MRRLVLLALVVAHALWPVLPALAQDDGGHRTDVVKVEGIIDRHVARLIERRIAQAGPADVVVLQIDSPGTLGVNAAELAGTIARSRAPVVAWVGPSGSLAQGSAVLLLAASHLATVAPGAGVGPGLPVDLGDVTAGLFDESNWAEGSPGRIPTAPTVAANLARANGRRAAGVERLYRPGAEPLSAQAAIDAGVVNDITDANGLAATSVPGLLGMVDGTTVTTFGDAGETDEIRLDTEGSGAELGLRFSELGPVDRILHAVSSPSASYVLLVLGLWGLLFEALQPGFGLAGFAGAAFVALAIYSFTVLPANWLGLGLLAGGIGLLALDVRLRQLGLLTVGGTAAFAIGSFLLYRHVAPSIDIAPWVIWAFVAGSVVFFGFGLTAAIRAREAVVARRQSGLVGLVGEAASDLAPEGQIVVKGAMWQGRSLEGPIPGGTKVRVRGVEGLVLEVTPEP